METIFPSKRPLYTQETTDFTKCIICQLTLENEDLNYLTKCGIPTLKNALTVRKDDVYDRLWSEIENIESFLEKKPRCHRGCRSNYTHKKELEKHANKRAKTEEEVSISDDQERGTSRSTKSVDYKTCCFICNKKRDSKGNWQLTLIATETRQRAVHEKAKYLNDEEMLVKVQGYGKEPIDMIAADFRYHKSCMDTFMNRKPPTVKLNEYDSAFNELVTEISDSLLKDRSAFYTTQLLKTYRGYLAKRGVENVESYRSDRLKKRLQNHFGSDIQIVAQRGKASIVCSSNITVREMCALATNLQRELEKSDTQTESEDSDEDVAESFTRRSVLANSELFVTAKHLRGKMKEKEKAQDCRSESFEITYESAAKTIPDDLYNHLAWMICDTGAQVSQTGRVILTEIQERRVLNIAQELMANTTTLPMPNHVGLSMHILKQTGSKQLVRVMNKFGHAISYEDAQRYISAEARRIDLQTEENGVFIPPDITAGRFTQCAFDNLDFKENTKDGSTLHATSHAIYQYLIDDNDEVRCSAAIPVTKARRRTIDESDSLAVSDPGVTLNVRREARSVTGIPLASGQGQAVEVITDENFVWALIRLLISRDDDEETAPSWNTFNEVLMDNKPPKSRTVIGYGPLHPDSPTNPAVVQASLDYFMLLTRKLGQDSTVVTVDQAIYDIVKGIVKKYPQKYETLVVRLGGFHIAENFMGCIGYLMKEGGIEEILFESGVCKRGTANKVIAGKDYYKMVRCHSLVSEAMVGLAWDAFEEWLLVDGRHEILEFGDRLNDLHEALKNKDAEAALSSCVCVMSTLQDICPEWREFVASLGKTAKYWLMYVEMVSILRRYIKAERAGDWQEHLKEVQNMLPVTVAAKHTNYMSCLPLYLKDMKELSEKHPVVYDNFMKGNFTVHRTQGRFNGTWTDMALEQTYNKEGKTSLLKGITQSPATREKYVKTAPFLTKISESVKDMAQLRQTSSHHHGESARQVLDDQKLVENIRKIVNEKMVNPFTSANFDDLINIASGEKAPSSEVINARDLGLQAMRKAEEEESAKIVPPKLTTFSSRKKSVPSKAQNLVKIYQDESGVSRALCFFQACDDQTRNIAFSHEWTKYPTSLFEVDPRVEGGYSMRKGTKSDYLTSLKALVSPEAAPLATLPASGFPTVFLVDAMAFVNRFQYLGAKIFDEVTRLYAGRMLNLKPSHCTCVHFVGDRYDVGQDKSLKGDERHRRDQSERSREYHPSSALPVPDFKSFMKNPRNKANLLDFFSSSLQENKHLIPDGVTFFLGGTVKEPGVTLLVTNSSVSNVENLSCIEHEEADTRIFAHLHYSVQDLGCTRAVLHATDTDVIMLAMYYFTRLPSLQELWVQTKPDSYLPVHTLVAVLSRKYVKDPKDLTSTLLCAYVLSGCDTVSYPFKRGKKKAASVAIDMVGSLPTLSAYGDDGIFELTEDIISEATLFFTALYGRKGQYKLNTLRQHMFVSSKSDLRMLPPTDDAFRLHLLRALYQLAVYKTAHLSEISLPPPTEFGRVLVEGKLCPVLMTISAKPNIQQPPACKCKSSKCLKNCSCVKAGVACCVRCYCLGRQPSCGRIIEDSSSEDDDDTV